VHITPVPGEPSSSQSIREPGCTCWICLTPELRAGTVAVRCASCRHAGCPHATWHGYGCTNSNAGGQLGSRFDGTQTQIG